MPVAQNDILRVTCRMTYGVGGGQLQNVWYFAYPDAAPILDSLALIDCGTVIEQTYTHVLGRMSDHVQFIDYAVKNMTQDTLLGSAPWPTFTVGGSANDPAASQVSALVLMQTNKPRVQGRVYIPGFTEANSQDGLWSAVTVADMAALGAELLSTFLPASMRLIYVVYNVALATFVNPVSTAAVVPARTQRRRSIGFGA